MKINEVALKSKAGVIPYYFSKGKLFMLFMTPSNPTYGGPLFQIAKGKVEEGEDVKHAAFREGTEELGLAANNMQNMHHITTQIVSGLDDTYILTLFATQVTDPTAFGNTDMETGKRAWMTLAQFTKAGRQNQLALVQKASQKILTAGGQKEVS
jgi:predicted NUDIX family NTP pyrophosphohydrolase